MHKHSNLFGIIDIHTVGCWAHIYPFKAITICGERIRLDLKLFDKKRVFFICLSISLVTLTSNLGITNSINNCIIADKDSDNPICLFYGEVPHGEIWNYSANDTAWTFNVDVADVYYNLTGLSYSHLDENNIGFTDNPQTSGGSYMTINERGLYSLIFSLSFEASQGDGLYGVGVAENFDITLNRNCYARDWAKKDEVANVGGACFVHLVAGDTINMQVENEDNDRDIKIHTANVNLVRICD